MAVIDYSSFAFKQGADAYALEKKLSDNPYEKKDGRHFQWNAGYKDAKHRFEKGNRKWV